MANITSPGIGSGLDVSGIVSQLVALERKPIDKLEDVASTIQTRISAFGKIQSLFSTLRDAAAALGRPTLWQQTTATSSDATALTASASGAAATGSYSVQVARLAQAHTLASAPLPAGTSAVGTGTLKIELGSWNADQSAFTPRSGSTAVDIAIGDGDNTLQKIRDKINAANAGVTAAIVTDASGARLTLRSKETGATQALRITATDANGAPTTAGLGTLAFDPPAGATGLSQTQAARNAEATINGLAVTSESNTLAGVLDGASVTLLKETGTGSVNVTVASDTTAMKTAMTAFTTAYNALNSYLAEQTKYDESTKTAGTLQGDSTALGLRGQLRGLLRSGSTASSAFGSLNDIGFHVQRDGSISTDPTKLEAAFSKLPELAKLFSSADDAAPEALGFGARFRQLADRVTGSEGAVTTRSDGLKKQLERNGDEQDRLEAKLTRTQERLLKQYTALDTQMGQLSALSSYVSAQVAQWNKG
jgi:flagellar hook-associated protein 2